jgi:hypothetical protein
MKTKAARILLIFLLLTANLNVLYAQQTVFPDSSLTDSSETYAMTDSSMNTHIREYTILDSLKNDSFINANFRKYAAINNQIVLGDNYAQRDVPSVKEVRNRPKSDPKWIFWVIVSILSYIAGVRTFNQKNFKASLNSVFSMKFSFRLLEEKGVIFNYITLQLFTIFVLIAALFTHQMLIKTGHPFLDGDVWMYMAITGSILLVYALKFLLHAIWGWLLQLNKLAINMISNTVTTSNFIALVIFPVLIIMIYIDNPLLENIFIRTIAATFLLSVMYRVIRAVILQGSYFRYPIVYLIIYLCILEISPWLIILNIVTE